MGDAAMTGFIIAAITVIWLAVLLIIACKGAVADKPAAWLIAGSFWLFLGLGALLQQMINEERSGPCVQSEVRMMYDPALKMTRPAEICTNRGKWVD